MIGPLKLIASCTAALLVSFLLISSLTSPAEAGHEGGSPADTDSGANMPAPYEWVMVLLFFVLVIAFHHCRRAHRQRA